MKNTSQEPLRIQSPGDLNQFIRTVTPGVWALLAAVILALILALAWSVFGTVEAVDAAGAVQEVHPITFVTN